ncbi:MAG: asparagine synthase (glutamine-hydrolyzing) [Sedimentibacter sp.]
MCGISGILNTNNGVDIKKLKCMTDIIKHRGPDDEGFYLFGNQYENFAYGNETMQEIKNSGIPSINELDDKSYFLGLGHRRLSIIDISENGHQPMRHAGIVITYNGEIYNYIELREELKKFGYSFETEGDTEVLIKAYKHWGEDCVKHFNGIWSFAIWDKYNKKLFCSRDRFGEKPFHYYLDDECFIFSSEIKQIIEYGIEPVANQKVLFAYLFYNIMDFSEETFFENIYNLRGGYNLSIELSSDNKIQSLKKYKYWEINYDTKNITSFDKESEEVGEYLKNSIKLRLRSDVEIGSCLSGGLDSSSIVTLACNMLNNEGYNTNNFKTFTSCYDDSMEMDERYYSDMVVKNSKCSNFKVKPSVNKIKSDLESLIWHQEEPFISLSIFAGWCVMEDCKNKGIKVLLDGQGGDETLLGYERFYAYALKDKIQRLKIHDAIKEYDCNPLTMDFKKQIVFN